MADFVWRDGSRLTPYMAYQVERLNADMLRLFGVEVLVTSGIRTHDEQIAIFLDTYTAQASGSGAYGDVRWWQGVRYVRTNGSGTAAAPGQSNHEIQGDTAAMDLRDSGDDPGISSMGSARAEWLRANCGDYGLEPEGYEFDEAWHYRIRGIYQATPASAPTAGKAAAAVAIPTKGKKMDLLIMAVQPADGGLRRYLVDIKAETKHEISSVKFDIYKNAGMPILPGVQPYTYGDEFATV